MLSMELPKIKEAIRNCITVMQFRIALRVNKNFVYLQLFNLLAKDLAPS